MNGMKAEWAEQLEQLVEDLSHWREDLIEIVEHITRVPGNLDRHFTTRSSCVMKLEFVGIAFSGARLMLLGKAFRRDVDYQVACDRLQQSSLTPDSIYLVERLSDKIERHSTLRRLENAHSE